MKLFRILVLAFGLASGGSAAAAGVAAEQVVIKDWISVTVPAGYSWQRTEIGLVILQDGAVRTPLQINIIRGKFASVILEKQRETAAGPATYQVVKRETGGSGGPEWRMRIDLAVATIEALQQRESGQPDFSVVWQVVDSIRIVRE